MADHANSTGLSQGAKDGGGDGNDHINIENFTERLRSFYFHWREHKAELWADCGVLAIATPPPSTSWALNMWLLGYEFPETLMVLSEKQIHFLCSQNKASLLDVIKKAAKEAVGVDVVMHVKAKGDDGTHQMDAVLRAIRSDNNPVVGYLAKEAHEVNEEELGRQLQVEHAHQKNEETAWRLAGASIRIGDDPGVLELSNELIAYKNVDDLPYRWDSKGMVEQIEKLPQEFDTAEREALITEEKLVLARDKSRTIKLSNLCIHPCPAGWGRQIPGNRITADHVQFYREVMEVGETLGGWRRSADEPVEIEGEHGEREGKNKINEEFEIFVSLLNDLWIQPQFKGLGFEFDRPLRDLGFYGVHAGATEFIVPAAACLIKLTYPLLVITLSEIAMVSLERVVCGQKNFDMVIVFKDLKRNVFRLKSIPTTSLERIKGWLDSIYIKHYQSRINLRWRPILKTIMVEPHMFIEDGEWDFLNMDRSDSDSEKSDKDYEPSDVEAELEPDDGDSNSESLACESSVESEDDEEDSEEDLEKEEMIWSEWEEATNADREVGNKSNSEGKRRRHHKKKGV
ncbi:FACT complex subunit spt16 [Ancistrocladus abbreviatus]